MYLGGRFAVNSIAFFVLMALIGFFVDGGISYRKFNKLFLIPVLLYLVYFVSLGYSENLQVALFSLQVNFSVFLLPILFGFEKTLKIAKNKFPENSKIKWLEAYYLEKKGNIKASAKIWKDLIKGNSLENELAKSYEKMKDLVERTYQIVF